MGMGMGTCTHQTNLLKYNIPGDGLVASPVAVVVIVVVMADA
jgi:hypothetical protein